MEKKTKKTKKVVTSQRDIDEMAELSGERDVKAAPKYSLPSLKINGKIGGFFKTVLENGEMVLNADNKCTLEEVKKPTGVILQVRKSFSQDGAETQLFSSEGGNRQDSVFSIFEKKPTAKGTSINIVFQGVPAQIKTNFPEMKMTQVIYFLLDQTNEIVRLKVKGMSLGHIFKYWEEFESNEHTFQYQTILGEEKGKNKYGSYIMNTFTKGALIEDLSLVKPAMAEVKEKVDEIEAYYKERDAEAKNFQGGGEFVPMMDETPTLKQTAAEINAEVKETQDQIKSNSEGQEKMPLKQKPDDKEINTDEIPY